ncbi:MAG: hypothetical protein QOE77_3893 [Blastocatellia bacterium]|jgi:hypothetical protein|nr:hypothetical protein [Blastocatellia bacterium]
MTLELNRFRKLTSFFLATCVLAFCAGMVNAAPMTGKLTTSGSNPVLLNGSNVNSGTTVFSGATIQSPKGVGATLDLGVLGRLDISPETIITVSFSAGTVTAELKSGYVVLTTKKGVKGIVRTSEGQILETDSAKLSSVIARTAGSVGPEVSAPVGAAGGGIGGGAVAGVVGAVGAAVGGAAAVKGGGRGSAVSPASPNR